MITLRRKLQMFLHFINAKKYGLNRLFKLLSENQEGSKVLDLKGFSNFTDFRGVIK